jgi:hypothetical protein
LIQRTLTLMLRLRYLLHALLVVYLPIEITLINLQIFVFGICRK